MKKIMLTAAACSGFLAVALGAFGAHGLKPHLSPEEIQWFETASRYHFYHTLALLVAAWMNRAEERVLLYVCSCFLAGIFLFSGSLYLMAVTGIRALGMITPLGGLCFLAGWALLAGYIIGKKGGDE